MMMFSFADPKQVWLELPSATREASWQQTQSFSTPGRCWQAYLNQLCLNVFLPWLQEEHAPQATAWLSPDARLSCWEGVNGSAISMGNSRLILIPTEAIDRDEFRVPQEWVDIPSWAADYYLAVQVDPDEQLMKIWGYTTHRQLKAEGNYDPSDRTYGLDGDDLIPDLNALWVARQLCPDELTKAAIAPLPALSQAQAENLLQRLGNTETVVWPRLAVPFELWGALIENDSWRQQLYRRRQGNVGGAAEPSSVGVNLSQWFQNAYQAGWQSLEALFGSDAENLAFSFRATTAPIEAEAKRVKLIDFSPELTEPAVVLLVALTAETDGRVGIRVQLRPTPGNPYLPANIELTLRSESGQTVQSVRARDRDNFIQLKRFKSPPGMRFRLQVTLGDFSIAEDFVV